MSTTMFYLKACFINEDACAAVGREFEELLQDVLSMYDDWQRNRQTCDPQKTASEIIARHPLAGPCVEGVDPKDEYMNGWSGVIPSLEEHYDLEVEGDTLYLSSEAYSLSNWDYLVRWLLHHGALCAGWIDAESADPWGAMVMIWSRPMVACE